MAADLQAGAQALTLLLRVAVLLLRRSARRRRRLALGNRSYLRIERILASFTLVFLCYVASAIYARPDWGLVLHSILTPRVALTPAILTGAIALLGTTLTSYVYFWESIEVAERRPALAELRTFGADAAIGMCVAGSSFLFVLIATAATVGAHHVGFEAPPMPRPHCVRWPAASIRRSLESGFSRRPP